MLWGARPVLWASDITDTSRCAGQDVKLDQISKGKILQFYLAVISHDHGFQRNCHPESTIAYKWGSSVRNQNGVSDSVKCYRGQWKIRIIPSICMILSQAWYHYVQCTNRHHGSLLSHCSYQLQEGSLTSACYLLLRWPTQLAVQTIFNDNNMLKLPNFGETMLAKWNAYAGAWYGSTSTVKLCQITMECDWFFIHYDKIWYTSTVTPNSFLACTI